MQNRSTFEYAVIRYVPRVEREEFLNVGVILFSKRKRYLGIRFRIDEARILAFYPEADLEQLRDYLAAWRDICAGAPNGGKIGEFDLPSRFRWLVASRSTIIQSSKTHPGLCNDPETALDKLFDDYLA